MFHSLVRNIQSRWTRLRNPLASSDNRLWSTFQRNFRRSLPARLLSRRNLSRTADQAQQVPLIASYQVTNKQNLERITVEEIKHKLNLDSNFHLGRIFFSTGGRVCDLLKLKSFCHLYVVLYHEELRDEQMPTDDQSLEALLVRVVSECQWETGLKKWLEASEFECSIENLLKKDAHLRDVQPKFRVSCNRSGSGHKFESPRVCSLLGHLIDLKFGWPIKMANYDLEVFVNFYKNMLTVSLTLTKESLDKRNIIEQGPCTLRANVCYALLRLSKIQHGDLVLDPMSGSGAIAVENLACCREKEWLSFTMAGDITKTSVARSKLNIGAINAKPKTDPGAEQNEPLPSLPHDVLRLDVRSLPLRDGVVDVFVSDLPFGKRSGSRAANRTLYAELLREMARAASLGSARAILQTLDKNSMELALKATDQYWQLTECLPVRVGNLPSCFYLLKRTNKSEQ